MWIEILVAIAFFSVFILPYVVAWIINLLLSKRKQFSFSCDRFSPLGLYLKNILASFKASCFRITISLKKVSVQTNFKKSILGISTSSPFIIEFDGLNVGVIPEAIEKCEQNKPVSTKLPIQKEKVSEGSDGNRTLFLPRILVLFSRLLDIHFNSIIISLGDNSFPKRIEVLINDVVLSGSVQRTYVTTVGMNLNIRSISLNNRENAFDSQPNISVYNCWLRVSGIVARRLILQQVSFNLGDYVHILLDKSLYRQYTAFMKAFQACKPAPTESLLLEEKDNQDLVTSSTELVEKWQHWIVMAPHAVKIAIPKMELDLVNADRSHAAEHHSLHVLIGCSVKYASSFYDVFFTKPKAGSVYVDVSIIESPMITCDGVSMTLNVGFKEVMNKLDTISLLYNHKKTVFSCGPSLFQTIEYIMLMLNQFPAKQAVKVPPKKKKTKPLKVIGLLLRETSLKVEIHIEEIVFSILPSSFIPVSAAELAIQTITLKYYPSSSRPSLDTSFSARNDFMFNIGAIDLKTMATSKDVLIKLIHKADELQSAEDILIPPCSQKMVSFGALELACSLVKFEQIAVDCSSKSTNINLTYASVELLLYVVESYLQYYMEFKEHRKSHLPTVSSADSLNSKQEAFSTPQKDSEVDSTPDMDNDETFIQSILNNTLIPEGFDRILSEDYSDVISPNEVVLRDMTPDAESESELSDMDSGEEILLSEEDSLVLSRNHCDYSFLPFYLTHFSLHISNVELQVCGLDPTKSTSYCVESISLTVASTNIDSFDRMEEMNSFNESTPSLPVFTPYSNHSELEVKRVESLDINRIPVFTLDEEPAFPLPVRAARRPSNPVLPMNQYQRNSGVEYTMSIECTNITIMGDEVPSLPKEKYPLFIPQVQLTFPKLLLVAIPNNQMPSLYDDIQIRYKSTLYFHKHIQAYNGFKRGSDCLFFLSTSTPGGNVVQLVINSIFARLAYGSIYVIYHSFVELLSIVKNSTLLTKRAATSAPKEAPKVTNSSFLNQLAHYQFMFTLSHCDAILHFTNKEGISVSLSTVSASYPDTIDLPLLSVGNAVASKVQGYTIVSTLIMIDQLAVISPAVYDAAAISRQLVDWNRMIDSTRKELFPTMQEAHEFVFCPTCKKVGYQQCDGYSNHCNSHSGHVPEGVQPFVVVVDHIDCSQDSDYSWGDLFYEASVQWKAFKTLRKGMKEPVPYPAPDVAMVESVAEHDAINETTIMNGVWIQVRANEVLLRLNDIVPEVSPELMEYSRVEVVGIDAVLTYNKTLHSRAHFMQFMQNMDDAKTPFDHGFNDILGFHLHDVFVDGVGIDFGDSLPPLVIGSSLFACGTLVLAELNPIEKYSQTEVIELYCSESYDCIPVRVSRSGIPLKFFTNLSVQAKQLEVNWGNAHDIVRNSMNHSFGIISPVGISKSPKLVWYDKLRYAFHGEIRVSIRELFRVNWMTEKQQDKKFESLTIDVTNMDVLLYKMGGVRIAFDELSIGVSHFKNNELVLNPLLIVTNSELNVKLLWGNKDTKNHYVELINALDDTDRYYYFRSHTIEWTVNLSPLPQREHSTTFCLRVELLGFLFDFWEMLKQPTNVTPEPNLIRNATAFFVNVCLDNTYFWIFLDDHSENGFSLFSENTKLGVTMYKLLPKYFASIENIDRMNHSKPDYSDLIYEYELFEEMMWIFPKMLLKMKQVMIDHLSLIAPQEITENYSHPFWKYDNVSYMHIGEIANLAVLKGIDSSLDLDEDIAELYNEKVKSNKLKHIEKNESKGTVLMSGLKVVYSPDVRDAITMTVYCFKPVYLDIYNNMKKTQTPVKAISSPIRSPVDMVVAPRQRIQRQPSIHRGLNDNPLTASINRSLSGGPPPFYRSESSCFMNHSNIMDSYRMSMPSMNNRQSIRNSVSFIRQSIDMNSRVMLTRMNSNMFMGNGKYARLRNEQKEKYYQEMKNMEKEASRQVEKEDPQLLTYLLKKAARLNVKKEEGVMYFTDSDVIVKKEDSKKDDKEDFLYGIFFVDSQLYIPSIETGSSFLLYLYQGTMVIQNKTIQQHQYNVINSSLSKVDLFLGIGELQENPWLSSGSQQNYKRIIQDFSLSLITRSKNGFIPTYAKTMDPTVSRQELVNRVSVTIGAFSVRMTSEEFYRFLNVIQHTLLVNPTKSAMVPKKDEVSKPVRNARDLLDIIESKVLSIARGNDNEMIPVLKIKYTLEEVEWSLLNHDQNEIAVATLRGLTGDHTFCFDNKSENKITLNDLRITNPSYSVKEQDWSSPDVILDPVPLDRDKDEQSNMLEVIAVLSNQYMCDGVTVQIFEHVGINVYPGCPYYILFQLTGDVASGIYRYFFSDDDDVKPALTPTPREELTDVYGKLPTPLDMEIKLEMSDDSDTPQFHDDISLYSRESHPTETSSNSSTLNKGKKLNNGCMHEFEVVNMMGTCVACKKKIGTVRHLAYRCKSCGIMVDKGCMMKALGGKQKKKEKNTLQTLVFFEHFRIGTVEINISTKGMSPLSLNNFNITLQHQIYSNRLTEWNQIFNQVKKAYTAELLKSAPSFMLRGWGLRSTAQKSNDRKKKKLEEEDGEVLTNETKIQLLLGV